MPEKHTLASVGNYWQRLRDEWKAAPEEGYVWTIHIDQTAKVNAMGLAKVNYHLKLSCSHVGPTMLGPYCGELAMDYNADLGGLSALLAITGGRTSYDADGWFKNSAFVMKLTPYEKAEDELFAATLGPCGEDAEQQKQAQAILGGFLKTLGSGSADFEKVQTPCAMWNDWDFHMTEGDMSGFFKLNGFAWGTTRGFGTVDASGTHLQGYGVSSAPFVGTFSERYDKTVENPFPYILRVYESGMVVFELHSANGGLVTVKFYGTVDKVPVGQTTRIDR